MATLNDDSKKTVDVDKEMLMEVRGIIDGCIESGSKDYEKALRLFNEWTRKDGKVIIHVPSINQVRHLTKDETCSNSSNNQRAGDYHVREGFEFEKIKRDLENAGFKIIYGRHTFSPFTWFLKDVFSILERKGIPGIGIIMLPFIWVSTRIEMFLSLKRGNGIFIVAEKAA